MLMILPPQRPGSYVLGVLTGQLGQVRLRSHKYYMTSALSSKGGFPDSDDFLSLERPLRPVLQVNIRTIPFFIFFEICYVKDNLNLDFF